MTRDDIIRMAREAGFPVRKWGDGVDEVMDGDNWHIQTDQVIDFFNLAVAAERNKVAQWMIDRSYATGHGDTVEDLLVQLEWQARECEREACAQVCESMRPSKSEFDQRYYAGCADSAAAIRARGEK